MGKNIMAKFTSRLSRQEVEKYFYQLCVAISETKNPKEVAELLRDLLSYQESEMIAKRLKIAELLLDNMTYEEIRKTLKVSTSTIARVQEWIKIAGDGYQRAVKSLKSSEKKYKDRGGNQFETWSGLKKKYPAYYWPEILLENLIKESNYKQKMKIKSVVSQLEKMKEKNELFIRLKHLLNKK